VPDAPVVEAFNYNRRLIQEAGRKVDRTWRGWCWV